MARKRSTLRSAAIVASGTLLSRLLGLVRVIVLAYFFGHGMEMDAFFIAFLIPNLFRKLFGEGALSAAVVPAVTAIRESGDEDDDASDLVANVSTLLFSFLALLTIGAALTVNLLPSDVIGWESDKWSVFQGYFTVTAPLVLFLCLAGLHAGVLNAYGKFAVPALLPALNNIIWISSILIAALTPLGGDTIQSKVQIMCYGLLAGGAIQFLIQGWAMVRAGVRLRVGFDWGTPRVREVLRSFAPTILALAVFQLNTLLDLLLAEWLVDGDGAVSAYSYANNVFQFPLGIVGIAMGTAIFPMLSRYAARGEPTKVTGGLMNGIRLLAFVVLPCATGILVLNDEVITVLLSRGEFTPEAASRSARVLFFFCLALPCVAALQLVTKAWYAMRDTRTPTKVALSAVLLNVVLNVILVQTPMKEAGLALSTLISSTVNLIVLGALLSRKLRGTIIESRRLAMMEGLSDRLAQPLSPSGVKRFSRSILRSFSFSALMGAAVWAFVWILPIGDHGGWREAGILIAAIVIGVLVYGALNLIAKTPELRELRNS